MTLIKEWQKLPVSLTELCIATTLRCGQSFRWRKGEDDSWACALRGRIIHLIQDEQHLRYRSIWPTKTPSPPTPPAPVVNGVGDAEDDTREVLQHYLNLGPDLNALYAEWSSSDANFRKKAPKFTGVRILRQDAWEALIGFICSSNNNIIRISQMVDKLCRHYGPYIGSLHGQAYHDFPTPQALTGKNVESHLRDLGFGYRAKYITTTAKMIADDNPDDWLDSLRNPESPVYGASPTSAGEVKPEGRDGYREAHEKLLTLQGVGPKVADCVCLMGLGWGEAVPVDTHVWQIAQRDYKFGKGKHSSLTKATYDAVANHFRKLWGKEAGWAHSVLFTADLRVFSERLTTKIEVKVEAPASVDEEAKVTETMILQRTAVKRKNPEDEEKPKVQLEEVTTTTSERVKRRKRR